MPLRPDQLESFVRQFEGEVIGRHDARYDTARLLPNARFDGYPALIVRPRTAGAVAEAIRLSRETGLTLAVRGGGHSVAGHGLIDGGIVLDLGLMRTVEVDPKRRVGRAGGGTLARDYTAAAQAHGLATPFGDTGSVGIGGLTLGGGIGWLVRRHGLTIDSLLAAELVTGDGELIRVTQETEPELFWAIRGGGGNFGVVTALELALHPVGTVTHGVLVVPATPGILGAVLRAAFEAPDELTVINYVMAAPPDPSLPAEIHGRPISYVAVVHIGAADQAERDLAPFRSITYPILDDIAAKPYAAVYPEPQPDAPRGGWTARGVFVDDLDGVLEPLIDAVTDPAAPGSLLDIRTLGGQMARVRSDATAFAHRERRYLVWAIGDFGTDLSAQPRYERWVEGVMHAAGSRRRGAYANFLAEEGRAGVSAAYPPQTYERLRAVKRRFDPENVFRINQNIEP